MLVVKAGSLGGKAIGAITGVGAMGGGGLGSSSSPSSGDDVSSRFDCLLPSGDLEAFLLRGVGTIDYEAVVESSRVVVELTCRIVVGYKDTLNSPIRHSIT